jgi:hypothetical protein
VIVSQYISIILSLVIQSDYVLTQGIRLFSVLLFVTEVFLKPFTDLGVIFFKLVISLIDLLFNLFHIDS